MHTLATMLPHVDDIVEEIDTQFPRTTILTLQNYIEAVVSKFYPDLSTTLMTSLLKTLAVDYIAIHTDRLIELKILPKAATQTEIKTLLNKHKLKKNLDYVSVHSINRLVQGGASTDYYLSNKAFEICLFRHKPDTRYARYLAIIHDCTRLYLDYQQRQLEAQFNVQLNLKDEALKVATHEIKLMNRKKPLKVIKEEQTALLVQQLHTKVDDLLHITQSTLAELQHLELTTSPPPLDLPASQTVDIFGVKLPMYNPDGSKKSNVQHLSDYDTHLKRTKESTLNLYRATSPTAYPPQHHEYDT